MNKILCICLSATYQRSVVFENLQLEKVNRSEHYGLWASGKAVNTARVLSELEEGCAVTVCPLGKENCEQFIELAERDKLNLFYVPVPGKIRECWTLLDRTARTTTELVVGETDLSGWTEKECQNAEIKLLKLINEQLGDNDIKAVVLAGSRQGKWNSDLYATIAGMCADAGKIFLADYIAEDLLQTIRVHSKSIIKINDEEYCKTFSLPQNTSPSELKSSIIQKSRENGNIIIITRGEKSTLAACNGTFYECPIQPVDPVNTTACGDSFNAGFIHEYLKEGDIDRSLKVATECAAKNACSEAPGSLN